MTTTVELITECERRVVKIAQDDGIPTVGERVARARSVIDKFFVDLKELGKMTSGEHNFAEERDQLKRLFEIWAGDADKRNSTKENGTLEQCIDYLDESYNTVFNPKHA